MPHTIIKTTLIVPARFVLLTFINQHDVEVFKKMLSHWVLGYGLEFN